MDLRASRQPRNTGVLDRSFLSSLPDARYGIRKGELFAGKYRIDRVLGAGGMGVVLLAHHVELDDRVAIKLLLPEVLNQGEAVARFFREAQAAAKIKSEHVARVHDVGSLDNGAPYMVMEFLEGEDLGNRVEQRGPLAPSLAAELLLQACEAIAEAHSLGIVHRDLKPSNLFVIQKHGAPLVKVLDFGLAKRIGNAGPLPSITSTTATMGSPLYMSPEQMQSTRDVDLRTDIWALGAILYELTTGVPPFAATSIPELVMKLLTTSQAPVASVRPGLPAPVAEALDALIGRCLEKDRERRFATVTDFARALAPLAPSRARVSLERITGVLSAGETAAERPVPAMASTTSGQTISARGAAGPAARRHRRLLWFAAPVALGVFAWFGRATSDPPATSIEPEAQPAASATPSTAARQVAPQTAPEVVPVVASPEPAPRALAASPVPTSTAEATRTTRAPKVVKKTTRRQPSGNVDVYDDRK